MKKVILYLFTVCFVLLFAYGLIGVLGFVSVAITDSINKKYATLYKENYRGVSSPWYEDGLHIVDEGFMTELSEIKNSNSIVAIGSSLSIISFNKDEVDKDDNYKYNFLVCGNGSYKSDIILYNLAMADGAIDKDDIVKLEVSFSTFRNPGTTITETTINKWKKYSVDPETGGVGKNTILLEPIYIMNKNLIRIQNVWELSYDALTQLVRGSIYDDGLVIPGNFRNNYFNYDAVAANCAMDESMRESLVKLMQDIRANNELIVEISPIPDGLLSTEYGKELDKYLESELVPFLIENDVPYLDYRYEFSDADFCDGVHLGYDAGIKYTKMLDKDIKSIIGR